MRFEEENELRRLIREELRNALGDAFKGTACDHLWSGVYEANGYHAKCSKCKAEYWQSTSC